jgi:tektin-4
LLQNLYFSLTFEHKNRQSTPESWAQNSHDNIVAAENERMASIQMRELVNNILHDTSKDMREQADKVENEFAKRIEEVAGAKAKMENQLENVNFLYFSFASVMFQGLNRIFN